MIRILLAEDQALVRDGLCALLEMEEDLTVRAVSNGQEALDAAAAEAPDIAILDVRMPVMDGVMCTQELRKRYPRLPILILTTFDDRALVQGCLEAGAHAYLLKDIDHEQLVTAIRLLVGGERLIPGDLARALLLDGRKHERDGAAGVGNDAADRVADDAADPAGGDAAEHALEFTSEGALVEPLTPRQQEVLELIAEGLSNREIARRLYLSEGTVKNTVSEIYARLGVRDRVQAVLKMLGSL